MAGTEMRIWRRVRTPVGSPGPRCRNGRRWPLPVQVPGKGLVLQEQGKTSESMRTVELPPWLVSRLLERQVNAVPNEWDVVFCSAMEKLRDTSNTTKHVRELLDE